ncbi:hypothetical protein MAR_018838 [Mya arenaria]|uniref:Uncharacterized protein n=1 Tax=Mya arenaria TaxID=6604 RepID=A0ABY7EG74_MYAAR|nr:hypothetical protein MAR_018838 [Mya arenaria]
MGISKDNNKTKDFKINNNSNSSSSNNNSSSYSVEGGISTSRSLRDIILEEEARSNKKLSKQSTNSEMKAKFSWRDVKKQQQNKQKGQGQEEVTYEGQSWGLQGSNRNQVTAGSPTLKINPTKGVTSPQAWSTAGPTSSEPPEIPWSGEIIQSPTNPICSFYDIVKDEQLKIEEQAIQDLLIHYKAADSVEERITVERVVTTAATPLWKRERLQSS